MSEEAQKALDKLYDDHLGAMQQYHELMEFAADAEIRERIIASRDKCVWAYCRLERALKRC